MTRFNTLRLPAAAENRKITQRGAAALLVGCVLISGCASKSGGKNGGGDNPGIVGSLIVDCARGGSPRSDTFSFTGVNVVGNNIHMQDLGSGEDETVTVRFYDNTSVALRAGAANLSGGNSLGDPIDIAGISHFTVTFGVNGKPGLTAKCNN